VCEFKVYLDGKKVFEDAVYVKSSGGKITLKSILGEIKEFENCQIAEVNVNTEKLTLESRES
jgi:predicted RNA-binding protein